MCRTIFWAEAGVIKSSLDDGSGVSVIASELGNITAIDVSLGNFAFRDYCQSRRKSEKRAIKQERKSNTYHKLTDFSPLLKRFN